MKEECISLQHISKKFNENVVLKDVNAVLHQGEILGFLGPSGAGKTTTIKILTGQLKPTDGEAFVLGMNCQNIDETIYEQIGIVTDASGVYERMSVYDNLKYFAKILSVPLENIDILLKRVGLYEHKNKLASQLSKGQTQRLILTRAILHTPKVLFLDEPTSGLDPTTALEIHKLLKELRAEGMAIFLTTHNMEEADLLCDRVAFLNKGEIVELGNPDDLKQKYATNKVKITFENNETITTEQNSESIINVLNKNTKQKIKSIHSVEPNLAEIFLSLTGRDLK